MKKMKTWILVVIAVCVTALVAGMIGYNIGAEKKKAALPAQTQAADDLDYFLIATEYGSLYYPDYWEEHLVHTTELKGDALAVTFNADVDGKLYPLFTMTIGGGEGTEVGTLTDESGVRRTVYLSVAEILEDPALDEGQLSRVYAMQEDLNFVIDHLK